MEYKVWYIGDIPRKNYPQMSMRIKLSLRVLDDTTYDNEYKGRQNNDNLNWGEAPFTAYLRSVEIEDYTGYCQLVDGPVEYLFDERLMGWEEVEISGCERQLGPGMYTPNVPTWIGTSTLETTAPTEALITAALSTTTPAADEGSLMPSPTSYPADESTTTISDQEAPEETGSGSENGAMTLSCSLTLMLGAMALASWAILV
jgi:hypothetical protein